MKLSVPRISITNIPVVRAIVVAIFSLALTNSARAQLYGIEYDTGNLYQISTANAALSLVGNTGITNLGSLEYRPSNGLLYAIRNEFVVDHSVGSLYRINPTNASVALVGSLGPGQVGEGSLVIAPNGTAYAAQMGFSDNPTLFKLNLDTAVPTTIGLITGGFHDINGLAWRSDNMLVGLDRVSDSLLAINPSTAASSVIAAVSAPIGGVGGMAAIGDSGYFATGNISGSNSLYSFNLNSGAHSLIGSFSPTISGIGIGSLAFVVPEPASLSLAVLAIVPLFVRRRRSQVKRVNSYTCLDLRTLRPRVLHRIRRFWEEAEPNGSGSGTSVNASVPEPTALVLLIVGLIALFPSRRGHLVMRIYCPCCARFVALRRARLALGIMVSLAGASETRAASDTWDNNPGGNWENGANWADNTTPGSSDTATFNLPQTYTVTFATIPVAIQALNNSASNVTFASSAGAKTLSVNSASGSKDVTVNGDSKLSLGTSGNPLNLSIGHDLIVNGGATLNVNSASHVDAVDLNSAVGAGVGAGTVVVDGAGSQVNVSSNTSLGFSGNPASLTYRNSAQGALSGSVFVAQSSSSPASATLNVQSGADLSVGSLFIATTGTATGTINVTGGGSTITQSGSNTLTIGSATGSIGTINIGATASGGTLTTGTGLFTINKTGTVSVGSGANAGTLTAGGNVTINGLMTVDGSSSQFSFNGAGTQSVGTSGITGALSIQNGSTGNSMAGALGIADAATMATGMVSLTGGSKLALAGNLTLANQNVVSQAGTLNISGPSSALSQSGSSTITIGSATNGTAAVNIGTTATGGTLTTGTGLTTINKTGTVTIGSDSSHTGTLNANGNMLINGGVLQTGAGSSFTLAGGKTMTIQNGGSASFNDLNIFTNFQVTGSGSNMTLNSGAGLFLSGSGLVDVNAGGSLTVGTGGRTIVTSSAQIRIAGGTVDLKTLLVSGVDAIDFSSGSLSYIGDLTVGSGGLLGENVYLFSNQQLTLSGTTTVEDFSAIAISGGTLNTGSLVSNSYITLQEGTVNTGSLTNNSEFALEGGTLNTDSLINSGNVHFRGGTLNTGSLTNNGTLDFIVPLTQFGPTSGTLGITGAEGLTLGPSTIGNNVSLSPNHTLNVTNTTTIPVGGSLAIDGGTLNTGNLIVNGTFNFNSGTLRITDVGGLTIGAGGVLGSSFLPDANHKLHVTNTLTVDSGAYLTLYSVVAGEFSAGSLVNNGDLVLINSAVGGSVVNNNAVTVVGSVDFNGLVSGPGHFFGPGTAHFNGGLAPGASPANVSVEGSLALADTNTLFIEIGGTAPGSQYDRLTVAGIATLDGALDVSLINGFTPTGGQQFTILTAGSIVNNGFVLTGSAASSFSLLVNSTSVILQSIGLAGDYNQNGVVDAADYVLWRKYQGTTHVLPNDPTGGTIGAAQYTTWRANFGKPPGSGSGTTVSAAVPEPTTLVLLMLAAAGCCLRRGRRVVPTTH